MSSAWRAAEEGDIEEDADTFLDEQAANDNSRDSILFLIDCSAHMFVPVSGEVPFASALKCVSTTMKNKIISSEDDFIGVMLYNTEKNRNPANFKGIYLLQPLDVPDAERIKEVEELAKGAAGTFQRTIGSAAEPAVMGNVFWSCSSAFGQWKQKPGSKRVFLFTNNDEPHAGNVSLQRAAKIRARDLSDLGIFIELFDLSPAAVPFDVSKFYSDILPLPLAEDEETLSVAHSADSSEKFVELMAKVRRRETKKRALGTMSMVLGEGVALAINVYSLYMEARKGQYVWMDEGSGRLANPVTEWVDQSTGAGVSRHELQFYYDFGGEKAVFTASELTQVKALGKPGLVILGFRPLDWMRPYYSITHSSFVFPNEADTRGSIVAFKALLDGMLELGQLAIGAYVARRTGTPKLVALIPQKEVVDNGVQLKPPGMSLVVLPFAEELRNLREEGELSPAESALVDQAKEIVSKLTFSGGFDPETFENPVLQRHYATLQALALDTEPDPEDIADSVMPDTARMQKRVGTLVEEFIAMIPASETPEAPVKTPRKRASAARDGEPPVIDPASIANDASKLAKLTVPVLKEYAQSIGIKPARTKSDLISQIVNSPTK